MSTMAMKDSAKGEARKKQNTALTLQCRKDKGQKLVTITCYDYSTARILDRAGVDMVLVGDSLAMTVLGHPNTLSVTVDEMLHHVKAVARGTERAMVVADMPFMSYQVDHVEAVKNAGRFIQEGGAQAVKLETATPLVLGVIRHLSEIGIPVVGHLGFTPQSINTTGGYKVQGKSLRDARKLIDDARALERAGVCALVLEMVPVEVANIVTGQLKIPTIGIGAGNGCDGQILVVDDVLGRYGELSPRFVRRYMDSTTLVKEAIEAYAEDIRTGNFPDNDAESFRFPAEWLDELNTSI